jgi:hypothetical protein
MTEAEWIALARRRLQRTLQRRRFASIRQLEKKISEAGPPDMRPEPIKISRALVSLTQSGLISTERPPNLAVFYKPNDFGGVTDENRRSYILDLATKFHTFTKSKPLCGDPFEHVVKTACLQSKQYHVISPAPQNLEISGYALERECDHILMPRTFSGPLLIVEDKNLREWLTPSSEEVWALIGKALRVPNAIPVLICRRMHFVGYTIFGHVGLACWQVYRQYFHPSIESDLVPLRHKDGLGFADITTDVEPPPALVRFFAKTLPQHAEAFRTRFETNRVLLQRYAIDLGLETDMWGSQRSTLFEQFRRELLGLEDHGEELEDTPFYP